MQDLHEQETHSISGVQALTELAPGADTEREGEREKERGGRERGRERGGRKEGGRGRGQRQRPQRERERQQNENLG